MTRSRGPNSSDPLGRHDWFSDSYVEDWAARNRRRRRTASLVAVAEKLPFSRRAEVDVLDVGGGYGALTRCVLERFTNARVVLVDFSQPMLDQAADFLGDLQGRVRLVRRDLRDPDWTVGLDGPFRAAVSSIALHNLRHPEAIAAVYVQIRELLQVGGVLADLDHTHNHDVNDRNRWIAEAGFADVQVEGDLPDTDATLFTARAN